MAEFSILLCHGIDTGQDWLSFLKPLPLTSSMVMGVLRQVVASPAISIDA
jgi:hypothetical protein